MSPRTALAATALVLVAAAGVTTATSSALFTDDSTSTATVTAAADWTPPTVQVDPLAPLLPGSVTVSATSADERSGVRETVLEWRTAGTSAWNVLGTSSSDRVQVRLAAVADGVYELRARATDHAGYGATSAVVTTRVDGTAPALTMADPGRRLVGTVPVTLTASDAGSGLAHVAVQAAPAGTTTFTDVLTWTRAPFTGALDTTRLADGRHDLRAVARDHAGNTTVTAVLPGVLVDNQPARGVDVQAVDGGGTPGRIERGDTLTYTFSKEVRTSSIMSGWGGEPTAVRVRIRDGLLTGTGSGNDQLDVDRLFGSVDLGTVALHADHVPFLGTATFNATMSATTVEGPEGPRTVVTITLGREALLSASPRTADPATMVWSPSGAVRDAADRPLTTTPVTESGSTDRDF